MELLLALDHISVDKEGTCFCDITLSFTDIVIFVIVTNVLVANMSFNHIRENKIIANISELTVCSIDT